MNKIFSNLVWKATIVSLMMLLGLRNVSAQKFWLTTYSFPGGPKTAITLVDDSCLLAGLTNNVIRSCDNGYSWDSTLNTTSVFTLFTAQSGRIFTGSSGKIFYSDNVGDTWDSVSLNHGYPVTKIIQNVNGDLFAITGTLDLNQGFVGAGVFYSNDNGEQWVQRNNGLGAYLSCEQIAYDSNGRLYLSVADEMVSGNAGLFYSDNSGQQWQHVLIDINGQNIIDNRIKVGNTRGLSVSPDDSIYLSISGTAVNAGVTLNIHKSTYDITDTTKWQVTTVSNTSTWWNDRLLNNIHFASNGDWYSSVRGSLNTGGTFFSIDKGQTWNKQLQGLGLDQFGAFSTQYFAENDSGKVFMVQFLDERIYWADTSVLTAIQDENYKDIGSLRLFPNPASANSKVELKVNGNDNSKLVTISNILGETVFRRKFTESFSIDAPEQKGIYILTVKTDDGRRYTQRLVVN